MNDVIISEVTCPHCQFEKAKSSHDTSSGLGVVECSKCGHKHTEDRLMQELGYNGIRCVGCVS